MSRHLRALVTTHHLFTWSGSEMVSVELIEALAAQSVEVDLYAPFADRPFLDGLFCDGVRVLEQAEDVDLAGYDLVYCHHQVLSQLAARSGPQSLLGDAVPYVVYNHLSPFEPFECPGPFCEADIADEIWCNSLETRRGLARFGDRYGQARLFPNPAPETFSGEPGAGAELQKLVVISNHLPAEAAEALDILRARGVAVTRIGRPEASRRVLPSDIQGADAVLTIGKSVQYALLARRPVYCYDHFGGPGWITRGRFERAAEFNFSGRCTPTKRTPEALVEDILAGFTTAHTFASGLTEADVAPFQLEQSVTRLLARVREARTRDEERRAAKLRGRDPAVLTSRWLHEAELYRLVDSEYGDARRHKIHAGQLARKLRRQAPTSEGART